MKDTQEVLLESWFKIWVHVKNQDWNFINEKFYFNFISSFLRTREQNGRLDTEINTVREKQNLLFLLYTIPSNMTFWPEKKKETKQITWKIL